MSEKGNEFYLQHTMIGRNYFYFVTWQSTIIDYGQLKNIHLKQEVFDLARIAANAIRGSNNKEPCHRHHSCFFFLHLSLQYFTSSHTFSHFFLHTIGRPQQAQVF